MCLNFNPRSRKGATDHFAVVENYQIISIHAPARERRTATIIFFIIIGFQSTLPQGSDLHTYSPAACNPHFNPRSRKGATSWQECFQLYAVISIHAPARERLTFSFQTAEVQPFQSTLPQGSDNNEKAIVNIG